MTRDAAEKNDSPENLEKKERQVAAKQKREAESDLRVEGVEAVRDLHLEPVPQLVELRGVVRVPLQAVFLAASTSAPIDRSTQRTNDRPIDRPIDRSTGRPTGC